MDKSFKNIIMGVNKWIKNRLLGLAFALSNVEKNAFSQKGGELDKNITQEQKKDQGTLLNSLINGVVTAEVQNLRWRTYKVLKASDSVKVDVLGYNNDGTPIINIKRVNKKKGVSKIKIDSFDNYPLEMVVDNIPIITSGNDSMENKNIVLLDEVKINLDKNGNPISATHGEISAEEYFASQNTKYPVTVTRDSIPKFEIEAYTNRLNVRTINDKEKLLEFYCSQYPDEYNRKSRFFISDIKKAIQNPRTSTILDIKSVSFTTYKTLGVEDFLEYEYTITKFDKIVEFNGFYVVKFICEVKIDGEDILDEYRMAELDIKYDNKEMKKRDYDNR